MATLQQQVQQHLDSTGISLRELARRSGISHQAIGNILRDTDLECAKYRRVMALEKELNDEKRNFAALEQVHEQREQHLKSCENALIEADQKLNDANTAWVSLNTQHGTTTQQLSDANAEIKRLTALSQTHAASWKAACVRSEHLQKQLDHGQAQFASLHEAYNQQVDDEREMLAQIYTLFVERENAATLHDQQVMRLRMYVLSLIAAIVLLIVSNFVVWGGV